MNTNDEIDVVAIMRKIQNEADELFQGENAGFRYDFIPRTQPFYATFNKLKNHQDDTLSCIDIRPLLSADGEEFISQIYQTILDREVDDEGRRSILVDLKHTNKEDIVKRIALSPEAKEKKVFTTGYSKVSVDDFATLDNESFIFQAYCFFLGRTPDSEGLNTYTGMLINRKITRNDLLCLLYESDEARCYNVQFPDYADLKKSQLSSYRIIFSRVKNKICRLMYASVPPYRNYVNTTRELDELAQKIRLLSSEIATAKNELNQAINEKSDDNKQSIVALHEIISTRFNHLAENLSEAQKRLLLVDNVNQQIGAVARQTMLAKWISIDNRCRTTEKPDDTLTCKICGSSYMRKDYDTVEADCVFNGGHLVRYVCPNCGVIFGPSKFVAQGQVGIDEDYYVHYLGFSEGDSSYKEERAFRLLNPEKGKLYLNYGCGKWSNTLQKLRENGFNVYGYEPYAVESDNPYLVTRFEDLRRMKFDGIFSNDLLEHLIDPVEDLKMMKSLLIDENSLMSHCTACYDYKYEYTRFHVHFFLGDSVKVMAERAGLNIVECINDLEDNDFYCYLYAPKNLSHSFLRDMYVNQAGQQNEVDVLLHQNGTLYGPYYHLSKGVYQIKVITDANANTEGLHYSVTAEKGEKVFIQGTLSEGINSIEVVLSEEEKDVEVVINNKSDRTVRISDLLLQRLSMGENSCEYID